MDEAKQRLAEALLQAQAISPPPQTQMPMPVQPNPYMVDPVLEQAAQPDRAPIHPLLRAIMNHAGFLGILRNRGNQQVVDPTQMQ